MLFFLGIVAAPLLVGVFMADHLSRTQALRDADARLEVASVAATDAFQQERLSVIRALSSAIVGKTAVEIAIASTSGVISISQATFR